MAEHVDMKAMFEAKMGFSSDDVPLDDSQLENFLMLCHETMLKDSGMMEDEEMMEDNEMQVKVIKIHDGDVHGMMDKVLKDHSYG
tara:strand:- start:1318 stop:1572 length:255 start_codon:yes stop_codon:yes gene_type:complete